MPSTSVPAAKTVGVIARQARAELHQVEYLIRSLGLSPVAKAGNAYIYSDSDAKRICDIIAGRQQEASQQ